MNRLCECVKTITITTKYCSTFAFNGMSFAYQSIRVEVNGIGMDISAIFAITILKITYE